MKKIGNLIGIVTGIINDYNFIFVTNNNAVCEINQVVGICISNNIYILSKINKINIDYFLKNSKEYFTSIASENGLEQLTSKGNEPKYSYNIEATILGTYEFSNNDCFQESDISINKHTPFVFQQVFEFDFRYLKSIYGLSSSTKDGNEIKLGHIIFPKFAITNDVPSIFFPIDSFRNHTLISGVTGSGKSRLSALILQQICIQGGHISIIDPHDEYLDLLANNDKYFLWYYSNSNKTDYSKKYVKIYKRDIEFFEQTLTASVLSHLLPFLTETQINFIYDAFSSYDQSDKFIFKKFIDLVISLFNAQFLIDYPTNEVTLKKAQDFAKADFKNHKTFVNRYIVSLVKPLEMLPGSNKTRVIFAVLEKINTIYQNNILSLILPNWQNISSKCSLDILNIDYDSNENIRRFVNSILKCFLINHNDINVPRLLVIDEAHLLLKENSKTSDLLKRLLRESRKYNLSIIFITQNEDDVPSEIKGQFQNRFRFREDCNDSIKYIPNQTCNVSLFKSKLDFAIKVDHISKNE